MQFLKLTLEELGEFPFKKSGMRLPRRIAREWCKRGILRHRHSSKEPCDIIRFRLLSEPPESPAARDLGICCQPKRRTCLPQIVARTKAGEYRRHSKTCPQFPLSVRAPVQECALRCAAFGSLGKPERFVLSRRLSLFRSESLRALSGAEV